MNTEKEPTHVYLARRPCGCVIGVTVDMADKATGGHVAEFIASGHAVERVDFEQYRAAVVHEAGFLKSVCPHQAAILAAEPVQAALL